MVLCILCFISQFGNWIIEEGSILRGVRQELVTNAYLLFFYSSCSYTNLSHSPIVQIKLDPIPWQKLESLTLPCRAERITCMSAFPAHFFCCSYSEVPVVSSIPSGICNAKLELKMACYIQNSTHEFFVTERSWAEGEVGFPYSRQKLYLLSMRCTCNTSCWMCALVHGVVNPHCLSSEHASDSF